MLEEETAISQLQSHEWPTQSWLPAPELPRVKQAEGIYICPYVPLHEIRGGIIYALGNEPDEDMAKRCWFASDAKSWEIKRIRRREIWSEISSHLDEWWDWLRIDSTPSFIRDMEAAQRSEDGLVFGVTGPKGSGKSILLQMILLRFCNVTIHVLFRFRDMKNHLEQYLVDDRPFGLITDETIKASSSDSSNLKDHVSNALDTCRKAEFTAGLAGINMNFEGWGDTLDYRIEPWGYNRYFQATRLAFFSKKNRLLGLGVLQREHPPTTAVQYYDFIGEIGQYVNIAKAFSREVLRTGGADSARDPLRQRKHKDRIKQWILDEYDGTPPPREILEYDYVDPLGLPADSVSYMRTVISKAIWELKRTSATGAGDSAGPREPGFKEHKMVRKTLEAQGWFGFRQDLSDLLKCWPCALYYAPPHPKASDREIVEMEGLGIEPSSLGTTRRRRLEDIATTELGRLGEKTFASWIDSSLAPRVGSGSKGQPDILISLPDGSEAAINVKLTLNDSFKESLETTPEDRWAPHALAALLLPRQLQVRLFPISGPVMTLNWLRGVLSTPDTVTEDVRKLMLTASKSERGGDR